LDTPSCHIWVVGLYLVEYFKEL